ncbi:hypothetical protein [Spirosoma telluris]|uniref:hypothetical protein n=1 Tax=Spirosoma telluris TaxID=2183553 RepID=UPI002FC33C3B
MPSPRLLSIYLNLALLGVGMTFAQTPVPNQPRAAPIMSRWEKQITPKMPGANTRVRNWCDSNGRT